MARILFLEINEIPYRLIDRSINQSISQGSGAGPYSHIESFLKKSWQFETNAVDKGELSPWVTWPTVHRGMSAERHHVLYLGQDANSFRGTTIWQDIRRMGGSIGIFGSLQSWPPQDPGPDGFYVPDTFAHDETCFPKNLEPLQKFNLEQVKKNGRTVQKSLGSLNQGLQFVTCALKNGLSFKSVRRLVWQVIFEKINFKVRSQRSCFQTILFWDIFKNLYFKKSTQLAYASFFSNHVAGMMHRFWKDVFPEDFGETKPGDFKFTIEFALQILDEILADVMKLSQKDPQLIIVLGSSMGQQAIHRDGHHGNEMSVKSLQKLVAALDLQDFDFTPLMAMAPQAALRINEKNKIADFLYRISNLTYRSGASVFESKVIDQSVSLTIKTPSIDDVESGVVKFTSKTITFREAGIEVLQVDPGTAYHAPEGVFTILNPTFTAQPQDLVRFRLSADQIKKFLLDLSTVDLQQIQSTLLTRSYLEQRSYSTEVNL